ncbi:serine hydrolase [Microbulbifer sp. THAF38]|uniref:serine hydrolase domain-containing protein n=1 Tax=Microbulbifer sp. THAF38 TaxID=2587856 RepID=UPI001268636E|nr:serine hydrolase domain-containing protein [Microbulbifer sp. THAF38]QFT55157.1 D-alanyl-D-alanine-carboxypeptidase/endopeptidase AmpH precursor [Microbulbifer sp. THAF38]
MNIKVLLSIAILALYSINNFASEGSPVQTVEKILEDAVDEKRRLSDLVGLGAIVIQDGKVVGLSVSGERKKGSDSFVSLDDKWHIGSITKSFTATMIARLIERGDLDWGTSIEDVFPDESKINLEWKSVTLRDLLTHTSGVARDFSPFIFFKNPEAGAARMKARETAVKNVLAKKPETTPGHTFMYSNIGYTIAGVMAEKKTGIPWENLIMQEVFAPLGIKSGGFGVPNDSEDKLDQPWGHKNILGFKISTKQDNSPILGPAGTIHISLYDLALYASEHLKGLKGRGTILEKESFHRLHSPNLNNYAYGWVIGSPKGLDIGNVHWHNGSNGTWYSLLAIFPDTNSLIVITSNDGKFQSAQQASWEIIKRLAEPLAVSHNM